MDSVGAQRPMTADLVHDQPAQFHPEDLAHLRVLLGDASPRSTPPRCLALDDDKCVHQPVATASVQTREEKQREKYRNRYHNRIATLKRLKDEVAALESVVHKQSDPDQCAKNNNEQLLPTDMPLTLGATRKDLMDNLRHALALKKRLQRERAQLRRQFIELCDRWRHVQDLVSMHHKLYVATESSFVMVKPLAVHECYHLRQDWVEMQDTVFQRQSQLSESICGWSATRSIEDGAHNFAIKKTYFNRSMDFFVPLLWRFYSDPKIFESAFAPVLEMQVRVVQHINDDNVVMLNEYIETSDNGERMRVKILWLLTRERTENGCLLGIHSLGGDRLKFLEHPQPMSSNERIVWNKFYCWVQLERSGANGNDTIMHVSGRVRLLGKDFGVWFKQLYQNLIRWDTFAFGTRFSIPKQ